MLVPFRVFKMLERCVDYTFAIVLKIRTRQPFKEVVFGYRFIAGVTYAATATIYNVT